MPVTVTATRYVTPLREGGSLPAVVETEEHGLFVVKFRGAGQGAKALLAELLVGGIADALELPVPEITIVELDEAFGRSERDPEIQDILRASIGSNVGLRYLDGAFNFDPLADGVDSRLASAVVWLDAFVGNLDRTARNPNMLRWQSGIWLIDHGAALTFHHNWPGADDARAREPFAAIRDHVLLRAAGELAEADERLATRLAGAALEQVVAALPDDLLMDAPDGLQPPFASPAENRAAYLQLLQRRLQAPRPFLDTAIGARDAVLQEPLRRSSYRR